MPNQCDALTTVLKLYIFSGNNSCIYQNPLWKHYWPLLERITAIVCPCKFEIQSMTIQLALLFQDKVILISTGRQIKLVEKRWLRKEFNWYSQRFFCLRLLYFEHGLPCSKPINLDHRTCKYAAMRFCTPAYSCPSDSHESKSLNSNMQLVHIPVLHHMDSTVEVPLHIH